MAVAEQSGRASCGNPVAEIDCFQASPGARKAVGLAVAGNIVTIRGRAVRMMRDSPCQPD
jgi:hypothetical protein